MTARRLALLIIVATLGARLPAQVPLRVATPSLRLDGTAEDFSSIGTVLVSRAGTIVVPQGDDNRLVLYSPAGKRLSTIGREGSGPGEFTRLALGRSGWVGDTLWVYDPGQKRFTFFSSNGARVRTEPQVYALSDEGLSEQLGRNTLTDFQPYGVMADGSKIGLGRFAIVSKSLSRVPAERAVIRMSRQGRVEWALLRLPMQDEQVIAQSDGVSGSVTIPFAARALFNVSPHALHAVVVQSRWATDVNAVVDVVLVRSSGDTVYKSSLPVTAVRIAPRYADSAMKAALTGAVSSLPPRLLADLSRQLKERMPRAFAPVRSVHVTDDGTVWLTLRIDEGFLTYVMLGPRGTSVAHVKLSRNPWLAHVERDALWAIESDGDGIPSLVRYALSAPKVR